MSPLNPPAAHDAGRPHPLRTLFILSIASLAFALAQTTLIPALAELAEKFNANSSQIAWTITGYLVAAVVLTPIFGRLGDIFGKRRMLVIALGIFTAGSIVSALGNSLEIIVLGRVLQGAGAGILPLAFGIIRDEFPADKVSSGIGLVSATLGIGGGLGLVLGGLILDNASYHYIFWMGGSVAAVAALLAWFLVPESPVRTPARVDVRGALVLGVGLTIPLIAISQANVWGWTSPRLLGMLAVGGVILAAWVKLQQRTADPIADISLLTEPPVLMTNLATLFVGFGVFASFILIPQLAEAPTSTGYGLGLDATQTGLVMLPGALVMMIAGPMSGVLATRFGSRLPLALGAIVSAAGLVGLGFDHGTSTAVLAWNLLASIGIGLAFAAMPNLIVEAVPRSRTGEATGFNTLVRSVGSSLGSQVSSAILAGSIVAGSLLPSNSSYTTAFLVAAGISVIAAFLAAFIPSASHAHIPVLDEIGAASPLAEPAYSTE